MTDFDDKPTSLDSYLDQAEFADNPEPRCPVVLLLDTSHSMYGEPIDELNEALKLFSEALKKDALASLRVEVAIITFGGMVQAIDVQGGGYQIPFDANQAFVTADIFVPPRLATSGNTPLGEAMRQAVHLLRDRKEIYKQNSLDYFRPWVFLITDGQPTDDWESAALQMQEEENRKGVLLFSVGVEGANMGILSKFSEQRPPLKLRGLAFGELFQWLSKSLSSVAHSKPGEQTPLPAVGWAQIETSH